MPHTAVQKRLHALVDTQVLLGDHGELNMPNPTEEMPPLGRGPGARWVYSHKRHHRRAKLEIREQRTAYRRKNLTQCPYVALPRGRPIDKGTSRRLLNDPLIFVLPKRKGRALKMVL